MNSVIVHVCVIFVTVLVVHAVHHYDCKGKGRGAVLSAPFNFSYPNWKDYKLNVKVNLKNLSPDVSYTIDIAWIYETDTKQKKTIKTELKRIWMLEKYEKNQCIDFKKKEIDERINKFTIYLALETKAGCCKNITILEGKAFSTNNQVISEYERNDTCLRSQACEILVDLANECIGPSTKTPETQATTANAGDTSSPFIPESVKPSTITGSVPKINYFNQNPTTSNSDVTTTPYTHIETVTTMMIGNDDKKTDEQSQALQVVLKYVIPSVIVLCVIILVMYIYVKKYRHRNSDQVDTIELNTYATTNDVIYADLSLAHGDSQPPRHEEESTYAQIIGVVRPVHGNEINN